MISGFRIMMVWLEMVQMVFVINETLDGFPSFNDTVDFPENLVVRIT